MHKGLIKTETTLHEAAKKFLPLLEQTKGAHNDFEKKRYKELYNIFWYYKKHLGHLLNDEKKAESLEIQDVAELIKRDEKLGRLLRRKLNNLRSYEGDILDINKAKDPHTALVTTRDALEVIINTIEPLAKDSFVIIDRLDKKVESVKELKKQMKKQKKKIPHRTKRLAVKVRKLWRELRDVA